MSKRWMVLVAALAIGVVLVERSVVMHRVQGTTAQVAAKEVVPKCPPLGERAAPALQDDSLPSVTQPGGIDPMGATRAIHSALDDCR